MRHTRTIAERLAEKILALRYDDLPGEAVHWARLGFLDTVAVTLAGAREPCFVELLATPGGAPEGCHQ